MLENFMTALSVLYVMKNQYENGKHYLRKVVSQITEGSSSRYSFNFLNNFVCNNPSPKDCVY